MKIIIQTPDFKADQKLIDLVNEKIEKLSRFSDQILESHVTMKLDKSDTNDNKIVDVRLAVPGHDLFASRQTKSFEESLAKVIEALKSQIETWKENA